MGPHKFLKFARRRMPTCPVCLQKMRYTTNRPGEIFVHCDTCGWSVVQQVNLKKPKGCLEKLKQRSLYEAYDNVIQELMR